MERQHRNAKKVSKHAGTADHAGDHILRRLLLKRMRDVADPNTTSFQRDFLNKPQAATADVKASLSVCVPNIGPDLKASKKIHTEIGVSQAGDLVFVRLEGRYYVAEVLVCIQCENMAVGSLMFFLHVHVYQDRGNGIWRPSGARRFVPVQEVLAHLPYLKFGGGDVRPLVPQHFA